MPERKKIADDELETEAAALVDEVLQPWKKLLSAEELLVMRMILESDLLVDPEGRLELRRMLADPEVEKSDEIARRQRDEEEDDAAEGEGG